jgi:hypothetical protein
MRSSPGQFISPLLCNSGHTPGKSTLAPLTGFGEIPITVKENKMFFTASLWYGEREHIGQCGTPAIAIITIPLVLLLLL